MNNYITKIIHETKLMPHQAWWLLEHITGKQRSQLQYNTTLSQQDSIILDEYIRQIVQEHKPLAYIIGCVPFLDLQLQIQPPTLIPRPETEDWVYQLITQLQQKNLKNLSILDIGTGSGCIALSLAKAFPLSKIYAIDIATSALQIAEQNAQKNNITNVMFIQSNLFESIPKHLKFDLIVSNPPYIDPQVRLDASVTNWEDHGALFADHHGMAIIDTIIKESTNYLTKKNDAFRPQLVIEIDASQGLQVKNSLHNHNFTYIEIKQDQFERNRTVWASL